LATFGDYPDCHTPGLWLHKTRPVAFSPIVDDFTVKYVGKQHAAHLQDALLRSYELTTDWEGKVYSGMTLKWYYKNRTCDISMPGYAANVLSKLQHDMPKHPIQFNVIYSNCAFTKLIAPKAGNITLATIPAREIWVMARLSHSCFQSIGLIALTVTTVSVVFCIVQI
jgi:hypothetical protein